MLYNEIKRFRNAIEMARDNGEFKDRMKYFPKGCCDDASELLACYLKSKQIRTLEVTAENEERDRHVWLETDDCEIIDITADQFLDESIHIGAYNAFYDSLIIVSKKDPYDIYGHNNLKKDYEIIMGYLK